MNFTDIKDRTKDFSLYKKFFDENNLTINDINLTTYQFDCFRNMVRILNEIYDDWDIQVNFFDNILDIEAFLIRFKNLEIVNTSEVRHNIKDLIVRIPLYINDDNIKINSIQGVRYTFQRDEFDSGYTHSHLPHNKVDYENIVRLPYRSFCTGSGPINIAISNFNSDYSASNFTNLLIQILTLVSHESLEGAPYKYIRDIYNHSIMRSMFYYSSFGNADISFVVDTLYNDNDFYLDIYYDENNKNYKIKDTINNRDYIKRKISEINSIQVKKKFLYVEVNNEKYFLDTNIPGVDIPEISHTLNEYFNGEQIIFTVEGKRIEEGEEQNQNIKLDESAWNNIISKINLDLNKKLYEQNEL